ncbi:MAG: metallophosphoesterase [Aestuariibacter sp.]
MRIFAVSDVHVDYDQNLQWLEELSDQDFTSDILILSGDLSDKFSLLVRCFKSLQKKFKTVLYVPGNHELWVRSCGTRDSIVKFTEVCRVANEEGVQTTLWQQDDVAIVPLFSWYDLSFGELTPQVKNMWMDYRACVWPRNMSLQQVNSHFLNMNAAVLATQARTVISFSHFLPRIDLMPFYIPQKYRTIYPLLGTELLEEQLRVLQPDIHIYGHSHVNRALTINGISYVNNAFGYPGENVFAKRDLVCVYEDGEANPGA